MISGGRLGGGGSWIGMCEWHRKLWVFLRWMTEGHAIRSARLRVSVLGMLRRLC